MHKLQLGTEVGCQLFIVLVAYLHDAAGMFAWIQVHTCMNTIAYLHGPSVVVAWPLQRVCMGSLQDSNSVFALPLSHLLHGVPACSVHGAAVMRFCTGQL